jgi:diguanylate cyclase (GGDEF)-like protein/PAS domain S-box-containing protein
MPTQSALDVLVVCESRPAGEGLLRSIADAVAPEYQCVPAWNQVEYLRAVENLEDYQAVLLGNDLGWSTGLELVKDLAPRNPGIPVIMITDSNGSDLVAAGFRLGLNDFLRSTQLDRLLSALRHSEPPGELRLIDPTFSPMTYVPTERNRAISSVLSDYVFSFYVYEDGTIVNEWRSDGLRRISGYSPSEFQTIGWEQIVLEEDHNVVWSRTRSVLDGDSPVTLYRIRTKEGETRWLREHTRPIWDPSENRYSRFVGSAQDVTDERMGESVRAAQMHVLELIAIGADFSEIFDEIVSLIAMAGTDPICVVHLYNENDGVLQLLNSSNLSRKCQDFLNLLPVDEHSTTQAASVVTQQMIVVPDARNEDQWQDEIRLMIDSGYESHIVMPFIGTQHNILGTLTLCRTRTGEPSPAFIERTIIASRLLGIAIEKVESERTLQRTELRYRRLAEEIPAVTFIAAADEELTLNYLSPQAVALIHDDVLDELQHFSLLDLVHPEDRRAVATSFRSLEDQAASVLIEFRLNPRWGYAKWLQCSAAVIDDHPDDQPCWQGVLLDVTSRRQAEQALRESQTQFRALFDNNPNTVFTLDTHGRFQRINPAGRDLTGYKEEDLLGRPFTSVLAAGELERVWYHVRNTLKGDSQRFETEIFTNRGNRIQISVTCVPYILDGQVAGVSGIAEDISERVRLQQQLSYQAYHDSLTGLPNRILFDERLNHAIAAPERTRSQIAVLFVDLDNFKVVNDSLGHENGDEYLKVMSTWLAGCVGPADTVARFGGDEFTILLEYPASDHEYPIRVAERIGRELAHPVVIQGHEINTGVSIGIGIQNRTRSNLQDIVRQADIALFQAKKGGDDTLYRVFEDSMHEQVVARLEFERDLRRAVRRNEFVVYYQPIIDLRTEQVVTVEALIRWNHPEREILLPGTFLPIAEETGQITSIDALVLKMACREITEWNRNHPNQVPVNLGINLSARDFHYPDLEDRIKATLDETGCDPRWLKLEITESTMMQDVTEAMDILHRLRNLGIGFSIDDFGTGYSSLAYLQRLPLDTLKIDRSFIDGLGGDQGDEVIVRTIISLASSLNLETIAEGIETPVQLARARELGCDSAQGFLIARPAPFNELIPQLTRATYSVRDSRDYGSA